MKPSFSINRNDTDGDVWEEGVYLHFGDTTVRVAKSKEEYKNFVSYLRFMEAEILES